MTHTKIQPKRPVGNNNKNPYEDESSKEKLTVFDPKRSIAPFQIPPHPGFETVQLPSGHKAKLAYNELYAEDAEDVEIELAKIAYFEQILQRRNEHSPKQVFEAIEKIKFHYRNCVALFAPPMADGWNRWSEEILSLFIDEKQSKVVWGSGNCGKSAIMGLLLYIRWRVRPDKRMVVIAAKVSTDASARVISYIMKVHNSAPPSLSYNFKPMDSNRHKGIFIHRYDKEAKTWFLDHRACIVNKTIKTDAKNAEIGANLIGNHPEDRLIIAFDEAQELPVKLLSERVFANWKTNTNIDFYAWGNPMPADFYNPQSWDMLFRMGVGNIGFEKIKEYEKTAHTTSWWELEDTKVLHLSMLDSPKDDKEEQNFYIKRPDGTKDKRLFFLAGKDNAANILKDGNVTEGSSAYYSQVLGFPYVQDSSTDFPGVVIPATVNNSKKYPLKWRDPIDKLKYFMGVDPSLTGRRDPCSITIGRMGLMMDGRMGVDLMNGSMCEVVSFVDGEDFMDTTVKRMYALSQRHNISLNHIAVETNGVGEVLRYALEKHIEDGTCPKWREDRVNGNNFLIVSPNDSPSDRPLFKTLGVMEPASDIVQNFPTEMWVLVRCMFLTRQLFNVPEYILAQLYNRLLNITHTAKSKFKLETKKEMKSRGVDSPNEADSMVLMLEVMRRRGFKLRFRSTGNYKAHFTPEYEAAEAQKLIDKRLGMASRLLGLSDNMASYHGSPKKKKTKRTSITYVPAV